MPGPLNRPRSQRASFAFFPLWSGNWHKYARSARNLFAKFHQSDNVWPAEGYSQMVAFRTIGISIAEIEGSPPCDDSISCPALYDNCHPFSLFFCWKKRGETPCLKTRKQRKKLIRFNLDIDVMAWGIINGDLSAGLDRGAFPAENHVSRINHPRRRLLNQGESKCNRRRRAIVKGNPKETLLRGALNTPWAISL